jgi:hypothetical protein
MTIELTQQQQRAMDTQDGWPPRVLDPRTRQTYVLVPAKDYDSIRDILEDERRQKAIAAAALRNAVGRMNEAP